MKEHKKELKRLNKENENKVNRSKFNAFVFLAKLASQGMKSANKIKNNMAVKHHEKKLKMLAMNSFKLRLQKLKRRKDKAKFKEELQQLARKYQQDIDDLEDEMVVLKEENLKLNKEKDNMVFNLKNAL